MVLKDVSVALDWTLNTNHAGFVVARALGYYNEEGLSVSLIEPGTPYVPPAERVRDGSATFAVAPSETAISSCSQTEKPRLQVACASPSNMVYTFPYRPLISCWDSLGSGTLMMPAGSCSLIGRGYQCSCHTESKRPKQPEAAGREDLCKLWGQVPPCHATVGHALARGLLALALSSAKPASGWTLAPLLITEHSAILSACI